MGVENGQFRGDKPVLGPCARIERLHPIDNRLAGLHDMQVILPDGPRDKRRMDRRVTHPKQLLLSRGSDAAKHTLADGDEPSFRVLGKEIRVRQMLEQHAELLHQSHALEECFLKFAWLLDGLFPLRGRRLSLHT